MSLWQNLLKARVKGEAGMVAHTRFGECTAVHGQWDITFNGLK